MDAQAILTLIEKRAAEAAKLHNEIREQESLTKGEDRISFFYLGQAAALYSLLGKLKEEK